MAWPSSTAGGGVADIVVMVGGETLNVFSGAGTGCPGHRARRSSGVSPPSR